MIPEIIGVISRERSIIAGAITNLSHTIVTKKGLKKIVRTDVVLGLKPPLLRGRTTHSAVADNLLKRVALHLRQRQFDSHIRSGLAQISIEKNGRGWLIALNEKWLNPGYYQLTITGTGAEGMPEAEQRMVERKLRRLVRHPPTSFSA